MAQRVNQIRTITDGYIKIPIYKVIILGPMCSGKTALSYRFCENKYIEAKPTLQNDIQNKVLKIDNENVMIQLWDTVGQERFAQSLTPSFYRGVDGVVFVFDTTSRKSFQDVDFWINEIRRFVDVEIPMVLIGTKCDLPAQVPPNEARIYADSRNLPYFMTSAKKDEDAFCVMSIFTTLALKMKEKRPLMTPDTIRLDSTMLVDPPQGFWKSLCSCF